MVKKKKNVEIDFTYKTDISWICPVRGTITEKVIVTRYRYAGTPIEMSI